MMCHGVKCTQMVDFPKFSHIISNLYCMQDFVNTSKVNNGLVHYMATV